MTDNVLSNLGTKFYIATGASANSACDTEAEYDALTWTEVGDITNFGGFGRTYTAITHEPVSEAATFKKKGGYNEGALTLTLGRVPADTGQAALIAARDNTANVFYNFKVEYNDRGTGVGGKATRQCFAGLVMSYTTTPGGRNNTVNAECQIEITGSIYEFARANGS